MEKSSSEVIAGNLGKILSIEEVTDYFEYEGYIIETATHIIRCLIDNRQDCCESWGHLSSPDNFEDFIGSTILKIDKIDIECHEKYGDGGEEKLNIETDIGTLQFSVYQIHSGYYIHGTVVRVEEKDT